MKRFGLDIGTKHIVLSYRDGQKIKYRHEVNGYLPFTKVDSFLEQLLVRQGVPSIKRGNDIIAIGGKAEQLAYTLNKTLRRPMAEGGLNKFDDDAQEIMAIIVKSIIGDVDNDTTIYYCTTAKPINSENVNIDFHKKIVKVLIEGYVGEGMKIAAFHANEARCLVVEESDAAIGISWGAGTVTVHAGIMGVPIFEFSFVGSGDWVDIESAKRFGYDPLRPDIESRETPTSICRRKQEMDLSKVDADKKVDQTIFLMYEILIENVVDGIVKGFNQNKDKFKFNKPVPIINAGGTSMPNGFIPLLTKKLEARKNDLGIPLGEVKRAPEPLFAVARGLLTMAEMHQI